MRCSDFSTMARPSPAPGGGGACRVAAEEGRGQLAELFRRDAGALVTHGDDHPGPGARMADGDHGDAGVGAAAIAPRVLEQVGKHAAELGVVGHHRQVDGQARVDADLLRVAEGRGLAVDQLRQVHRVQFRVAGARVVHELVDDRVELFDVQRHVALRFLVGHAHLGFQAQPRQRRAQVVRDAGQHHRAVFLHLGQLARHAVEAAVDLADLAGQRVLVQAGVEVAFADAAGGEGQFAQRTVDEPSDDHRPDQRGQQRDADPHEPGAARHRRSVAAVDVQPVAVGVDREPDPGAGLVVDTARHHRIRAEAGLQLLGDAAAEAVGGVGLPTVARLARQHAHGVVAGHGLDQRDTVDRVHGAQRGARQVHQVGGLLRRLHRARLELHRAQGLHPGEDTAGQQHRQQEEGAPEQAQLNGFAGHLESPSNPVTAAMQQTVTDGSPCAGRAGTRRAARAHATRRAGSGGGRPQACTPSGTNT